jgi:hypothetical protein
MTLNGVTELAEIRKIGTADQMIVHAYLSGATLRELQNIDGRTHERIRQVLLREGVPLRQTGKRASVKEQPIFTGRISKFYDAIPEMKRMYTEDSASLQAIATKFSTTPMTVRKLLIDAGVLMRARGPRAVMRETKPRSQEITSEQFDKYAAIIGTENAAKIAEIDA